MGGDILTLLWCLPTDSLLTTRILLLKITGISLHDGSREEGVVFTFLPARWCLHWCLHCRSAQSIGIARHSNLSLNIGMSTFTFCYWLSIDCVRGNVWVTPSSVWSSSSQQPAVCCHGKLFCVTVLAAQPASTPGLILQQYLSTWAVSMASLFTIVIYLL